MLEFSAIDFSQKVSSVQWYCSVHVLMFVGYSGNIF